MSHNTSQITQIKVDFTNLAFHCHGQNTFSICMISSLSFTMISTWVAWKIFTLLNVIKCLTGFVIFCILCYLGEYEKESVKTVNTVAVDAYNDYK